MRRGATTLQPLWTVVDGQRLFARVATTVAPAGSPTVVLVHGFVISSRYMVPVAEALAPRCRVYAPDLPGFGHSAKPQRVLDVAELADALARWMEAVGLASAVLLGNSFGCQVVAALANRHPARVERAVLVGPTVDPAGRSRWQQAARLALDAPRERGSLWLLQALDYRRAGLRRAMETGRHAVEDRIEAALPAMTMPTLVVRGALDPLVPQGWAEAVAARLPRGRLVTVPGKAHALNFSAPRELAAIVCAFLALEPEAPLRPASSSGAAQAE